MAATSSRSRSGLSEDIVDDRDSGQLLTGTLMDYGIPRADTLPAIAVDFSLVRFSRTFALRHLPGRFPLTNPLGARGVEEGGTVASTPP
jgi:aerobic carbon-monoxide dehydrogenase large subunit